MIVRCPSCGHIHHLLEGETLLSVVKCVCGHLYLIFQGIWTLAGEGK